MKKIFIILFLLMISSLPAQAWKFNYTYIDPAVNACPPADVTHTGECLQRDDCCIELGDCDQWSDPPANTICTHYACRQFAAHMAQDVTRTVFVPKINETCYRPTCYWRPAILEHLGGLHVEPLTNRPATIGRVIDGLTDEKIKPPVGIYPAYYYPPNSYGNIIYRKPLSSNDTNPDGINYKFDKFELSTGTSAMQGLLWSWRMLSPKWQGVWVGRTTYENIPGGDYAESDARVSLPSASNAKNIIVISDGLDSDGPAYNPGGLNVDKDPESVSRHDDPPSGTGFVFPNPNPIIYSTCDAHVPQESITDADYAAVCQKLKDEGIKVHVVLYGYDSSIGSNERLRRCAEVTEGQFIPNATPQNISTVLQVLFASIANQKIKLIK